MMFRRLCFTGLLSFTGLLAFAGTACTYEGPPSRFPDIRFDHEPPIRFNVAKIEIVDSFQPTFHAPDVEHEFPVPPERALESLAKDRFQAFAPGSNRVARFIIEDASVREAELPRTPGIAGAFTVDQAQRYDAHVAVRLEIIDETGLTVRTARAQAMRSRSVAEGITSNDRDQTWYDMTRELVEALDQELERQMDGRFAPYI